MAVKTTSFKLDSELLKQIKIKATEKEITQSELITDYLLKGLKEDNHKQGNTLEDLEKKLNIKSRNHIDVEYKVPARLKVNADKRPMRKFNKVLPKESRASKSDLKNIIGIVSSPEPTDSTELKKGTYIRG
ncbi:MAG: hypothetical protein Q4P11_00400 [Methanobrevibacter sp.]|nr:hypothetical protein [Methanobrevibacter sp.]